MGSRIRLDGCGKSRPTGIRSPGLPARRESNTDDDDDDDNNNNNNVKTKVIPVITGTTGTISKSFRKYVSNIP